MKKRNINITSIGIFSLIFITGILCALYLKKHEILEIENSFSFALKYYSIPVLLLGSHLCYLAAFEYKKSLKKWFKIISFPFFLIPILACYISLLTFISLVLNETIGTQETIVLNGKIIELEKTKAESISYVEINNKTDTIRLRINKKLYNKYTNEKVFSEIVKKGSFNFYYKL
ncbi:hypothetical protein [Winogradskyella schleiferi]|uniref:hypothetical protein n=1 Tax=Winogradskyella schleiferi TaxID=2686078 RepID=UPI0015BDCE97|nr:hypothetical protein [Winogradskyella schleiferi]